MLDFEVNFADFFTEFPEVLCSFQHEFLIKFISSDCMNTCFSCRRELNFEESEVAECSTESNEKSAKFRRKIYKDNYPKILNFNLVSAPQNRSKIASELLLRIDECKMLPKCSKNAPKMLPRCIPRRFSTQN